MNYFIFFYSSNISLHTFKSNLIHPHTNSILLFFSSIEQTIMDRILREYEAIKRDNTYLNARNRMQYLHKKLSHIKSLILNYNQNQFRKHTVSNRSSTSSNCGNSSSIKFNSLNSANNSRIRSKHHTSVPQQSNRSKMITSS